MDRRRSRMLGLVVAVAAALGAMPSAAGALGEAEPFLAQQWGLRQIGAQDAWTVTRGAGVRIAVIDTGVDLAHEELRGAVVAHTRCIGTRGQADRCAGSAQDDNGHGTHVAGTIAAPLNGKGIAGVAPEASLLVVKALDAEGGGEAVDVAAAIDWVVARGAAVVNLSLADATSVGQVLGSPIETAIRRWFAERGTIFVLAGGNREDDGSKASGGAGYGDLPALVVAATGPDGSPARYNLALGSAIWGLAAPGGDGSTAEPEKEIVSTYWYARQPNGYAWSEGTSMAAPHVAAAAGMLVATGVTGRAAVDRILTTLRPLPCGAGCRGALDVRAALGARPGAGAPSTTTTTAAPARPRRTTRAAGAGVPSGGPGAPVSTTAPTTPPTAASPPPPTSATEEPVVEAVPSVALPVARDITVDVEVPTRDRPVVPAVVAALALLGAGAALARVLRGARRSARRPD